MISKDSLSLFKSLCVSIHISYKTVYMYTFSFLFFRFFFEKMMWEKKSMIEPSSFHRSMIFNSQWLWKWEKILIDIFLGIFCYCCCCCSSSCLYCFNTFIPFYSRCKRIFISLHINFNAIDFFIRFIK